MSLDRIIGPLIGLWFATGVVFYGWVRASGRYDLANPHPLEPSGLHSALVLGGLGAVPIIACLALVLRRFTLRSDLGRGLALVLLGTLAWSAGSLGWFYLSSCEEWGPVACVADRAVPYPSGADYAFLLFYVLLVPGLALVGRAVGMDARVLRQNLWVLVAGVLLTAVAVLPEIEVAGVSLGHDGLFGSSLAPAGKAVSWLYFLGDAVVLSLAVVLLRASAQLARASLRLPLVLLVLGTLGVYVSDMLFFVLVGNGTYHNGSLPKVTYLASLVAITSAAALAARVAAPPGAVRDDRHGADRVLLAVHDIIVAQAEVLGRVAYMLANRVPGLHARPGDIGFIGCEVDRAGVLDQLLTAYDQATGGLGLQVALHAAEQHRSDATVDRVLARHEAAIGEHPAGARVDGRTRRDAGMLGALQRMHRRSELMLDAVPDGIVGLDPDGTIDYANPAASAVTGYSRDWLVGRRFEGLVVSRHDDHVTMSRADGSSFAAELSTTPILDDGEVVGSIVVFRDIGGRRKLERTNEEPATHTTSADPTRRTELYGNLES